MNILKGEKGNFSGTRFLLWLYICLLVGIILTCVLCWYIGDIPLDPALGILLGGLLGVGGPFITMGYVKNREQERYYDRKKSDNKKDFPLDRGGPISRTGFDDRQKSSEHEAED